MTLIFFGFVKSVCLKVKVPLWFAHSDVFPYCYIKSELAFSCKESYVVTGFLFVSWSWRRYHWHCLAGLSVFIQNPGLYFQLFYHVREVIVANCRLIMFLLFVVGLFLVSLLFSLFVDWLTSPHTQNH